MTVDRKNSETQGKGASARMQSDPRILALVRLLARRAAERDFACHLEAHGLSRKTRTTSDTERRRP